jgi:hypothetical protein
MPEIEAPEVDIGVGAPAHVLRLPWRVLRDIVEGAAVMIDQGLQHRDDMVTIGADEFTAWVDYKPERAGQAGVHVAKQMPPKPDANRS